MFTWKFRDRYTTVLSGRADWIVDMTRITINGAIRMDIYLYTQHNQQRLTWID